MLAIHPNRRGARRIYTGLLPLLALLMSSAAGAATITVTSTADSVKNDGECTLREAIKAANGNAVSNGDCAATDKSGGDKIVFLDTIGRTGNNSAPTIQIAAKRGQFTIKEPLTIDGKINPDGDKSGDAIFVVIDANGPADGAYANEKINRIFDVQADTVLKNLVLQNGRVNGGNGGLIRLDVTEDSNPDTYALHLDNMLLVGGTAASANDGTGGKGGAIYVANGSLKITQSIIINSEANRGGAIWTSAKTYIKNSVLGAFAARTRLPRGTNTPEDTAISRANIANGSSSSGSSSIKARGGHIYVKNADLTLIDTTLQNGEAIGKQSAGGAVFIKGNEAKLTIKHSTLFLNYSSNKGGALALREGAKADIEDTKFRKNGVEKTPTGRKLTQKGGAIYARGAGEITVDASSMAKNHAQKQGGAIWAKNTDITIISSVLRGNSAASVTDPSIPGGATVGRGGAIYYTGMQGVLTIKKHSRLVGNRAGLTTPNDKMDVEKGAGGAIFVAGGEVQITDSRLARNYARLTGGAIEVSGVKGGSPTVTIRRSILGGNTSDDGNFAGKAGGAIHITAGKVTLIKSTVSYNKADQGGGLWNGAGSTLKVKGSTISHNTATGNGNLPGNGGGIYGYASIEFSTITHNSAANTGGGIANLNGRVEISNSIVAHNSAPAQDNIAAANIQTSGSNIIGPAAGLRSLQFSAGALVHPLLPNSDAVGATNRADRPLGGDQRGVKCQADCDAGSFEYKADLPTISVAANIPPGSDTELVGQSNVEVFGVALTNTTDGPITITRFSLEPRGGVINTLLSVRPQPHTLYVIKDGDGDGMLDKREDTVLASKPLGASRPFSIDCTPSGVNGNKNDNSGCQLRGGETLNLLVTLRPPIENEAVARTPSAAMYAGGGMVLGLIAILSLTSVRRRTRLLMALAVITIGLTACSNADGPPPPFPTNSHFRLVAVQAETANSNEIVVTAGVPLNGPDIYIRLQDR